MMRWDNVLGCGYNMGPVDSDAFIHFRPTVS
jgi:hypothetical protein